MTEEREQATSPDERRPAMIELRGLGKTFGSGPQAKVAVTDVDLDIAEGDFTTVVGASGSGKTTILRMIDGLIKPTAGFAKIHGKEVTGPGRDRGVVFQQDCLLPWRTIRDNVAYGLQVQGVARKESRQTAERMLELMGLEGTEDQFPAELSGGMRQRVNLARALAIDPDVLLMDEPFAALDAQTREVLQSELLTIWQKQRKTVVFVTHQLDEAVYLADRVVVLAANPGTVREIVEVDLPRPRSLDIKHTTHFTELVDRLWQLIKREVMSEARL